MFNFVMSCALCVVLWGHMENSRMIWEFLLNIISIALGEWLIEIESYGYLPNGAILLIWMYLIEL